MFDWKMISSDSHVVEPPDLWTERMDRAFRDRGPRVVSEPDGDWWMIDGTRGNSFQGGAQVGKRFEHADELRPAARFSEVRPGAYQPAEFLRENEEDGIWGSVIYPTAGLQLFLRARPPAAVRRASARTTTGSSTSAGRRPSASGASPSSTSRTSTRPSASSAGRASSASPAA